MPIPAANSRPIHLQDDLDRDVDAHHECIRRCLWPIWAILGWDIGLVIHARSVYGERQITEDDIRNETERRNVR